MLAAVGTLVRAAVPVCMMLVPWLFASHWEPGGHSTILAGLAGLLAINLAGHALEYGLDRRLARIFNGFERRLRSAIFRKIGVLPAQAMSFQAVGALAQRVTGDVSRARRLVGSLGRLGPMLAQILIASVVLLGMEPLFTTLLLLCIPVIARAVQVVNVRLRTWAREGQLQNQTLLTRFIETVGGYRDLVASGRFGQATTRYEAELKKHEDISTEVESMFSLAGVVSATGFALLLFAYYFFEIGDASVLDERENMGRILSYAGLTALVSNPALRILDLYSDANVAAPSVHELRSLLETAEVAESSVGAAPEDGSIGFSDVSFAYTAGGPNIVDQVDFRIEPGQFVAIVGQSGSGKTTLFHLMLRLLEPDAGQVRIGGVPAHDVPIAELREFMGFIPQSPFIFDSTIRDNITMGQDLGPDAADRLERAVSLAHLKGLVEKRAKEGGLDAPVGAGGASLSAGERQRIALARMFVRDPRIIICDEYTANVDNATADLIHDALANTFEGRTRIVITHQLYSVRGADRILVLDGGTVVQDGPHDALIATEGVYRSLWETQRLE